MSHFNTNLIAMRQLMFEHKIDAYIIPSTDPHQCEYVPAHWMARAWITGFTGSAGLAVITQDFAGLWTDSRYFIQAKEELKDTGFELVELKIPHTPEHIDWIAERLPEHSTVAIWGEMISVDGVRLLEKKLSAKKIKLETSTDLIQPIWKDRPSLPKSPIFVHGIEHNGQSRLEKLKALRTVIAQKKCDFHLLASLDDIAWVLNLRGNDIEFNPVFISYLLLSESKAQLYIDLSKVTDSIKATLQYDGIEIKSYDALPADLHLLKGSLLYAPDRLAYSTFCKFPANLHLVEEANPSTYMKGIKNETELRNWRETMITDGVAMVRFLRWLDLNVGKIRITELSAALQLKEFRKMGAGFVSESFGSISAYRAHAAMAHYHPTEKTDVALERDGLYLIDSGGQYLGGTTDITRTICLGTPSIQEKTDYTLALKGTISLSLLHFPDGTRGYHIDAIARQALWMNHLNFGHGTGHGVGFFLSVHEGPHSIGPGAASQLNIKLEENMIVTIEPAFYREGLHGIRTENIVVVKEAAVNEFGRFLCFETLTLCPIDKDLIDFTLLTPAELSWLNDYHKTVAEKLSPMLDESEREWLLSKL